RQAFPRGGELIRDRAAATQVDQRAGLTVHVVLVRLWPPASAVVFRLAIAPNLLQLALRAAAQPLVGERPRRVRARKVGAEAARIDASACCDVRGRLTNAFDHVLAGMRGRHVGHLVLTEFVLVATANNPLDLLVALWRLHLGLELVILKL